MDPNHEVEAPGIDLPGKELPPPLPSEWPVTKASPDYAGFWIRSAAFLTDSIFIFVIFILSVYVCLLGYLLGVGTSLSAGSLSTILSTHLTHPTHLNILNSIAFGFNLIYFAFFLTISGQTPGKMIFGLKVTRMDGGSLRFPQALWRTFGYYLNQLTLFIGFLWVAFDSRKQGFHDKIARTIEIRITS